MSWISWTNWNADGDRITGYSKGHFVEEGADRTLCGVILPHHSDCESSGTNNGTCKRCLRKSKELGI